MADSLVRFERRGPAAWITLDRPGRRNALTPELLAGLHQALDAADADPGLRATVLTGAGGAFRAGADLRYFIGKTAGPDGCEEFIAELLAPLAQALRRLRASPRLAVAAVNGACYAGGMELLAACDPVLAAESAVLPRAAEVAGIVAARSPASVAAMKQAVQRCEPVFGA